MCKSITQFLRAAKHKKLKKTYFELRCLDFYFQKHKSRKNIIIQCKEFTKLWKHWKAFPLQYVMQAMFLKTSPLSMDQMKQFVPKKIWYKSLEPNKTFAIISGSEIVSGRMMSFFGIPQPKLICYFSGHAFYSLSGNQMQENQVDAEIAAQGYERIFLKPNTGSHGKGIRAFTRKDGAYFEGEQQLTASYIARRYLGTELILQEGINQTQVLRKLNPDCLNTVRIVSRYQNGEVKIVAATLRLGREGSIVDNAEAGGLGVMVDLDTGALSEHGRMYLDANLYDRHPDTGTYFKGCTLNHWDEVIAIVKKAAHSFHQFKYVGWDMAISDEGAMLLEMNSNPAIYILELTNGGLAERIFG